MSIYTHKYLSQTTRRETSGERGQGRQDSSRGPRMAAGVRRGGCPPPSSSGCGMPSSTRTSPCSRVTRGATGHGGRAASNWSADGTRRPSAIRRAPADASRWYVPLGTRSQGASAAASVRPFGHSATAADHARPPSRSMPTTGCPSRGGIGRAILSNAAFRGARRAAALGAPSSGADAPDEGGVLLLAATEGVPYPPFASAAYPP